MNSFSRKKSRDNFSENILNNFLPIGEKGVCDCNGNCQGTVFLQSYLHSFSVISWGVIVPINPSTGHEEQEPEWAKVSLKGRVQKNRHKRKCNLELFKNYCQEILIL